MGFLKVILGVKTGRELEFPIQVVEDLVSNAR